MGLVLHCRQTIALATPQQTFLTPLTVVMLFIGEILQRSWHSWRQSLQTVHLLWIGYGNRAHCLRKTVRLPVGEANVRLPVGRVRRWGDSVAGDARHYLCTTCFVQHRLWARRGVFYYHAERVDSDQC